MGGLPQQSYAWAFEAYDRFVETLSPEVRQHLGERREDSYMVVFGRTQVGKTTLILKLLGLPAQAVRAVSTVLRGTERRAIHPRQFPPNIGAVAMIAGASSAVGRMGNIQATARPAAR
jgi:hypothetical protein